MPIQVIPRRNNNTAITQPSTNAVLIQWLACPRLIQMPPKNKQCKENRRNSIFLEKKKFPSWFLLPEPLLSSYLGSPCFHCCFLFSVSFNASLGSYSDGHSEEQFFFFCYSDALSPFVSQLFFSLTPESPPSL